MKLMPTRTHAFGTIKKVVGKNSEKKPDFVSNLFTLVEPLSNPLKSDSQCSKTYGLW